MAQPSRTPPRWITELAPGLLFLAAVAVLVPRLAVPAEYVFDEVYHAYTAGQYVAGNADAYVWDTYAPDEGVAYMWNHPPAGVLAIASGILLWGDGPLGWRFASAIFGALAVVLTYALGFGLTRDRPTAVLAAGLLLVDGLWFVQSRIGMLDIFGTVFALGALLSLHSYLTAPPERAGWPIVRTGALLGLALATKWNAAYLATLTGLVIVFRAVWLRWKAREPAADASRRAWHRHLLWIPVGLGLVPPVVYLASYVPFFATGHDVGQFVELQKQIFLYHTRLEAAHDYQSSWWQWPLALRPVWYWVSYGSDGTAARIYANGNPFLFWLFLPAVAWLAVRWARERRAALPILLIGFFGQWLPWALVPRIAFAYHFLPAVPFGTLAVAAAAVALVRRGGWLRWAAVGYLLLVVAAFVFFYPVYAGLPLGADAFEWRVWIESWR